MWETELKTLNVLREEVHVIKWEAKGILKERKLSKQKAGLLKTKEEMAKAL